MYPSKFPIDSNFKFQISNCQFSISISKSQLKYKLLGFVDAQVLCISSFGLKVDIKYMCYMHFCVLGFDLQTLMYYSLKIEIRYCILGDRK